MTRLTPEEEKRIRDNIHWIVKYRKWADEFVADDMLSLLAEIDALRAENEEEKLRADANFASYNRVRCKFEDSYNKAKTMALEIATFRNASPSLTHRWDDNEGQPYCRICGTWQAPENMNAECLDLRKEFAE